MSSLIFFGVIPLQKQISKLNNGLTIATIEMDGFETIAVGAFVGVGSRYEPIELNGISHALEHMAFKGTNNRSVFDIAFELENVGANVNAFTSKDTTAYHVHCLSKYTELAIDIISDVIQHSIFPEEELNRERGVILQEIARSFDNPDHLVWDLVEKTAFPDQAYGRTILGSEDVIKTITKNDFDNYVSKHYTANNIIVVCAGKVDHNDFVKLCEKYFTDLPIGETETYETAKYIGGYDHFNKNFEQSNVVLGFPAVDVHHNDRYAYQIASQAFGEGMSSPLFIEVREKRGLVYSVFSHASIDMDHGTFFINAGTTPDNLDELFEVIMSELNKASNNLGENDVNRAKNQFCSKLFMSLERPMSQAMKTAEMIRHYGRFISTEETIQNIENVSVDDCRRVLTTMLTTTPTLQIVGDNNGKNYYEKL